MPHRFVHSALEEGLAKIDLAVATYGGREPLSLFCYGEPGTSKTTLAALFIERYRGKHRAGRVRYVLPCDPFPAAGRWPTTCADAGRYRERIHLPSRRHRQSPPETASTV